MNNKKRPENLPDFGKWIAAGDGFDDLDCAEREEWTLKRFRLKREENLQLAQPFWQKELLRLMYGKEEVGG